MGASAEIIYTETVSLAKTWTYPYFLVALHDLLDPCERQLLGLEPLHDLVSVGGIDFDVVDLVLHLLELVVYSMHALHQVVVWARLVRHHVLRLVWYHARWLLASVHARWRLVVRISRSHVLATVWVLLALQVRPKP